MYTNKCNIAAATETIPAYDLSAHELCQVIGGATVSLGNSGTGAVSYLGANILTTLGVGSHYNTSTGNKTVNMFDLGNYGNIAVSKLKDGTVSLTYNLPLVER